MKVVWNKIIKATNFILALIMWVLALPINIITYLITWYKMRRYDPEQDICPGCGFRGDSGTNYKTCRIKFTRSAGEEKAAIQHVCFRCGCDEWYTPVFYPVEKWLPKGNADHIARAKEALRRAAI